LRASARKHVEDRHGQVKEEALRRYPGRGQAAPRARWVSDALMAEGLPPRLRDIPRGTVARMAIDRWRKRRVDEVIADAVKYSAAIHAQPRYARRDMRRIEGIMRYGMFDGTGRRP
jgi:hypothetical protein